MSNTTLLEPKDEEFGIANVKHLSNYVNSHFHDQCGLSILNIHLVVTKPRLLKRKSKRFRNPLKGTLEFYPNALEKNGKLWRLEQAELKVKVFY